MVAERIVALYVRVKFRGDFQALENLQQRRSARHRTGETLIFTGALGYVPVFAALAREVSVAGFNEFFGQFELAVFFPGSRKGVGIVRTTDFLRGFKGL